MWECIILSIVLTTNEVRLMGLSPHLKTGTTFAEIQSNGKIPTSRDFLNKWESGTQMLSAPSFKSLAGSRSGPQALSAGNEWRILNTTSGVNCTKLIKSEPKRMEDQTHGSVSAAKKTGKNRHHTQVCYLRAPWSSRFQPIVALKLLGRFLSNLYILVGPYSRPCISNLKEIAPVVSEI